MKRLIAVFVLLVCCVPLVSATLLTDYGNVTTFYYNITPTMGTQTNYQIKFILSNTSGISGYYAPDNIIYTNGTTRADWYDINATDNADIPLPFWIENNTQTSKNATAWVNVPTIATGNTSTGKWYFGNSSQSSSTMNGYNTFLFFDDFLEGSLNASQWSESGQTPTFSNGYMTLASTDIPHDIVSSTTTYNINYSMKTRSKSAHYQQTTYIEFLGGKSWGVIASNSDSNGKNWAVYNGSSWRIYGTPTGWSANTYHTIDINKYSNTQAYGYIDGANLISISSAYIAGFGLARFEVGVNGASVTSDWIFIRNFVSTEPKTSSYSTTPVITTSFTANTTTGVDPLLVQFTDTTQGSPTGWSWTYQGIVGGNNTPIIFSTSQNPLVTFNTGNYSIVLNATRLNGFNVSTQVTWINVTVAATPVADFTYAPSSGIVPLGVQFTDASTKAPTSWTWNFIDGGTDVNSTAQNPYFVYNGTGTFTVNETASNAGGTGNMTKNNIITVNPMVATATANQSSGNFPYPVAFTGSSTGTPNTYYWMFGDTGTSTGQNPTHTYNSAGTFNVNFSATNTSSGFTAWDNATTITVGTPLPITSFTAYPVSGIVPYVVTFNDTSTGAAPPTSWYWDFGDMDNSTSQNVTHQYITVGTYTVNFSATNTGGTIWDNQTDLITVNAMTATASANPSIGILPLTVSFTGGATGTPDTFFWDFGDGNTTDNNQQNPIHYYTGIGTFPVNFSATNTTSGYTVWDNSSTITVSNQITNFTVSARSGDNPFTVNFNDTTLTNTPISSYFWDFGDGYTSILQNVSHTYTTNRSYTVEHSTTGATGNTVWDNRTDYIVDLYPGQTYSSTQVQFSGSPQSGTNATPIGFTDLSSVTASAWNWSFGDGTYSNVQNPVHYYGSFGTYTVSLNITVSGSYLIATKNNYITIAQTVPIIITGFSGTPTSGTVSLPVSFSDASTYSPYPATSWNWSFGDGSTSPLQNPSHTYNTPGTYNVSLTTSNPYTSNSTTKTGYITATAPLAGTGFVKWIDNNATFITVDINRNNYGTLSLYNPDTGLPLLIPQTLISQPDSTTYDVIPIQVAISFTGDDGSYWMYRSA